MELGYNYEWFSPSHLFEGEGEGVMRLCTYVCCVSVCECVCGGATEELLNKPSKHTHTHSRDTLKVVKTLLGFN